MASVAAADEERRSRIVAHLNSAHTRELGHLVRHHGGASARAASAPSLRDLTLQGMRVTATRTGDEYAIPFTPPLAGWDEVRPRLVAMDAAARRALGGLSDVYVTAYAPPRGLDFVVWAGVLLFAACCAGLPWTEPGTRVWRAADALFPGGAPLYRRLVRALCLPVLALHAAEACYFDRRLRRHGVDRWSALWWRWASSCFVEGVMAFRRFDAVVARKTAAKDGGKML